MNLFLQNIAATYFADRNEKNFNTYYRDYSGIAQAAAYSILRDHYQALEVADDLFVKLHNREDEGFQFDPQKSHVGYIWHSSANLAKIKWNKNRTKTNNLANYNPLPDNPEFIYLQEALINECENIKVSFGFSRDEYVKTQSLLDHYKLKLSHIEKAVLCDVCDAGFMADMDIFFNDFGCRIPFESRLRKTLKLKNDVDITYADMILYIECSIEKLERIIEMESAKTLDEIKKIKSKPTKRKLDKILFENTKVNMFVCESDFGDPEEESGEILEFVNFMNSNVDIYDVHIGINDDTDMISGHGVMHYSTSAQLDFVKNFIKINEDKENPGLMKRVLIDNIELKSMIDNISHTIKICEKDYNGFTKDDIIFCRDLVMSTKIVPNIYEHAKSINACDYNTQDEIRNCLEKLKDVIIANTQLKCSQQQFGFNSVGAVKSKSHRFRKFMKEEYDRKMVISEITENKHHKYSGEAVDKWDNGNVRLICHFINGVLNGEFKTFYDNGDKKEIKIYKNGFKHGEYKKFYKGGKIMTIGEYAHNLKVGSWTTYREDGTKDELVAMATDGSRLFELYDKNGNVHDTGIIRKQIKA